jgi:succinoglycan biosynthesis transport protein ExoP
VATTPNDSPQRFEDTGVSVAERPGTALIPREQALSPFATFPWSAAGGPGPEAEASWFGVVQFLHALRRRWFPALAVGLLLGVGGAAATWYFSDTYEAVAWLQVGDSRATMMGDSRMPRDQYEYQVFRRTQAALIRSNFVLNVALRRPGIAQLSYFQGEADPVRYLERKLSVSYPQDSEVLQIKLRGRNREEITAIVNAVKDAYFEEIVNRDRDERLRRRDLLDRQYRQNREDLRKKLEAFNNLAKQLYTSDSDEVRVQRQLLMDQLALMRRQIHEQQSELLKIDGNIEFLAARRERGPMVSEALVELALARDPGIREMSQQLAEMDQLISEQAQRLPRSRQNTDPMVQRMRSRREALRDQLDERRAELRPFIIKELEAAGGNLVEDDLPQLEIRRNSLARSLEELTREYDRIANEARTLATSSAELESRRSEIDQLEAVTNRIGQELEQTKLDLELPTRVRLIQEARNPEGAEPMTRLLFAALAGCAGLVLGGGLVLLGDMRKRRLSVPQELTQTIGVRVLGTLPSVAALTRRRKGAGAANAVVMEAIDGIRTILLRTAHEDPRVLLVSSAGDYEGKTTVASYLAASLARTGRRTLLVDGDLRKPAAHQVFGLPLAPGLCEVLRQEAPLEAALQPTATEGLWLLAAGSCDHPALMALGKDGLKDILARLRDEFEYIVFDTAPVLTNADTLIMGHYADAAVLSVRRQSASGCSAAWSTACLRRTAGEAICGCRPRRPRDPSSLM